MSDWVELRTVGPPFLDEITAALRDAGIVPRLRAPAEAPPTGARLHYGRQAELLKVIEVERQQLVEASRIVDEIFGEAEAAAERQAVDEPATVTEREQEQQWRRAAEMARARRHRRSRRRTLLVLGSLAALVLGVFAYQEIHYRPRRPHQFVIPAGWTDLSSPSSIVDGARVPAFLTDLAKESRLLLAADLRRAPGVYCYCSAQAVSGDPDIIDGDESFVNAEMQRRCPPADRGWENWGTTEAPKSYCSFKLISRDRVEEAGLPTFVRAEGVNSFHLADGKELETRSLGYLLATPPTFVYCELSKPDDDACKAAVEQLARSPLR